VILALFLVEDDGVAGNFHRQIHLGMLARNKRKALAASRESPRADFPRLAIPFASEWAGRQADWQDARCNSRCAERTCMPPCSIFTFNVWQLPSGWRPGHSQADRKLILLAGDALESAEKALVL